MFGRLILSHCVDLDDHALLCKLDAGACLPDGARLRCLLCRFQVLRQFNKVADALSNQAIDDYRSGANRQLWTLEAAAAAAAADAEGGGAAGLAAELHADAAEGDAAAVAAAAAAGSGDDGSEGSGGEDRAKRARLDD